MLERPACVSGYEPGPLSAGPSADIPHGTTKAQAMVKVHWALTPDVATDIPLSSPVLRIMKVWA